MSQFHEPTDHSVPPLANTYWVVVDRLLAGEYPGSLDHLQASTKIRTLEQAGVSAFIDLTAPEDGLRPYAPLLSSATYHRYPIRDVSVPRSPTWAAEILDAIDAHIARGGIPYVHCWGGIGRTGLIIGCWLARQGLEGEAALSALREAWKQCAKSAYRETPETDEQARYIIDWQKK